MAFTKIEQAFRVFLKRTNKGLLTTKRTFGRGKCSLLHTTTKADLAELSIESVRHPRQVSYEGRSFPLILQPAHHHAEDISQWRHYICSRKTALCDTLERHAAILFRGFPIKEPLHFDQFVNSFGFEAFQQKGSNSPRTKVVGNVITANDSPPDKFIPYHHELAFQPVSPRYLFFYCEVAPAEGGETTLVLSSAVYQRMAQLFPAFIEKLDSTGITYERIIPMDDNLDHFIGRGWKNAFGVNTESEAEEVCRSLRLKCEWLEDKSMKVTCTLPAFGYDVVSNKKTWFNHIVNFTLYNFNKEQKGLKRRAYLGSGERFPQDFLEALQAVVESEAVSISWQEGDVMLVDNRLALHARQPFTPPRKILATLCGKIHSLTE